MPSYAIVPAAGQSTRMGKPKLLLPWRDSTVIEQVLKAWQASHVRRVVVVVRPDDQELAAIARKYKVDLVLPPVPPPEMKASVDYALAHLQDEYTPDPTDGWLLAPADMPGLSAAVIDHLLVEHEARPGEILIPTFAKKRGHPVLFPWSLAASVASLAAGEGLNALVARNSVRLIPCDDSAILEDLDTPEDYHRLRTH